MFCTLDSRSRRAAAALPLLVRQQNTLHAKADADSSHRGTYLATLSTSVIAKTSVCAGEEERDYRGVHAITKASVWSANVYFYEWGWQR